MVLDLGIPENLGRAMRDAVLQQGAPMTYQSLKIRLAELRERGATCVTCGTRACYEYGRHDDDNPGLPCEDYTAATSWRVNGAAL